MIGRPPSNSYSYYPGGPPLRYQDGSVYSPGPLYDAGSIYGYSPIRDNGDEYDSYYNLGYSYGKGELPPSRPAEISPPSNPFNGGSAYASTNSNYNAVVTPIERLFLRGGRSKPRNLDPNKIPAPWKDPKTISAEHGTTEFLMIYAAEHYADGTESAMTLQCESPALQQDIIESYEMVWL